MSDRKTIPGQSANKAKAQLDVIRMKKAPEPAKKKIEDDEDYPSLELTEDPLPTQLSIFFYDGTTEADPDNPGDYRSISQLDDIPDLLLDTTVVSDGWPYAPGYGNPRTFVMKQNKGFRDLDTEIQQGILDGQWLGEDTESLSYALDRKQLRCITEQEFIDNNKILPVGVSQPNIKATLLDEAGDELDSADWLAVYNNNSEAIFAEDPFNDDALGYTWNGFQNAAHLKVEEVTARGYYQLAFGQFYGLESSYTNYYAREPYPDNGSKVLTYYFEGPFWKGFNTADKVNFKVTEEPSFDAAEYEDFPINHDQAQKRFNLFMIPRDWWGMVRFSSSPINDECFGIWTQPPKDFVMMTPRTEGNWQRSHLYEFSDTYGNVFIIIEAYGEDEWAQRYDNLNQDNAFTEITLPGDSEDGNGFWIFHNYHNETPELNYAYTITYGSPNMIHYNFPDWPSPYLNTGWCSWQKHTDESIRRSVVTLPLMGFWNTPYLFFHDGWWGSTPDGKLPVMTKTVDFSPGSNEFYPEPSFDPEHGVTVEYIATRTYKYYDHTDTDAYLQADRDKIVSIRDHFLSRTFCDRAGEVPNAFLFGCGEARAGDLLAVLEDNEKFLFIWRKTDERLSYIGPGIGSGPMTISGTPVEYNDLDVGGLYVDVSQFHLGYYGRGAGACPCPEMATIGISMDGQILINHLGHIELELGNELTPIPDAGFVPRIKTFGAWLEFTDSHNDYPTLHHGVDLGAGVRPLYFDQRSNENSYERRLDVFGYPY